MQINLDGKIYQIKAGVPIRRQPLIDFPENIRLDGQQQRKDRSYLSSWAIDRWSAGLGLEQINVDIAAHQYRLWDAENVDTRWESQIPLSPEFQVCTISAAGVYDYLTAGDGNLYLFEIADEVLGGGVAAKFAPPLTFGSYKTAVDAGGTYYWPRGVEWHLDKFHFLFKRDAGSNDRIAWVTAQSIGGAESVVGTLTIAVATGPRGAKFADMSGTYHMAFTNATGNSVRLYLGQEGTMRRVATAGLSTAIGSIFSPLQTDGLQVYLNLPEGIYNFDDIPNMIVDTKNSADKNCSQILFGNDLYFKNKRSLIKYDGENVYGNAGYDKEDGLVSEKFGEITAMTANWRTIFAAVKGGTYSHIFTRDASSQWQYYTRVPSAGRWVRNMFLSNYPDNIDRLWLMLDDRAIGYYYNPNINPIYAPTYAYVPTGYFRPPRHTGGMPEEPGAFYDTVITADKISDDNTILMLYGIDGSVPCATLGIVGSSTQTLIFGSPRGVGGYRIQPEFWLSRASGASGTTPLFRSAVIHYLKDPRKRMAFDCAIDVEQTAVDWTRGKEDIIAELDALTEKKLLSPFSYGAMDTKYVKVLDMPSNEITEKEKWLELERKGVFQIRLAEIR